MNSNPHTETKQNAMADTSAARNQLRSYCERAERLIEERKSISEDLKELFAEAKGCGFDTVTLKWAIAERALEEHKRQERDAMRDLYGAQLNLFQDKQEAA